MRCKCPKCDKEDRESEERHEERHWQNEVTEVRKRMKEKDLTWEKAQSQVRDEEHERASYADEVARSMFGN